MTHSLTRWAVVTLTCLITCIGAAHAQEAARDNSREAKAAKELYRQAVDAYAEQHFDEAIALFLRADELRPSPAHSYNIARAYEALGKYPDAVKWYRDYLDRGENLRDTELVSRRIAHLEKRLKRAGSPEPAPREPAPVAAAKTNSADVPVVRYQTTDAERTSDERESQLGAREQPSDAKPVVGPHYAVAASTPPAKTVGIVMLVTGAASLAGSLTFELLRRDAESEARASKVQIDYADKIDSMESYQLASRVLLAAGAGLSVFGTVLWLTAPDERNESDTQLALRCGLRGCGLNASGKF